ncbi:MAG: diguanylate cyclase [bacterium]|nr:diguanylate cyclase [bacterium]
MSKLETVNSVYTILISLPEYDRSHDGLLLQILLAESGLRGLTTVTTSSQEAVWDILGYGGIDLVVVKTAGAVELGSGILGKIREAYSSVPVVVVTDSDDREVAWKAIDAGAQDCLLKSELSGTVLGQAVMVAVERKRHETTVRRLEMYDPLTGLLNTSSLLHRLERLFERRRNRPDFCFALLLATVEDFFGISRRFGQLFADELLISLARRFELAARPSDAVARLHGHEFVLVLPAVNGAREARSVADRIRETLSEPMSIRHELLGVAIKWGIVTSREYYDGPHDMLGAAVLDLKCA